MKKEILIKFFERNNIPENKYSIYDGIKSDCIVLEKWGSLWKIFYVDERGGQHILDYSDSEVDAFTKLKSFVLKS